MNQFTTILRKLQLKGNLMGKYTKKILTVIIPSSLLLISSSAFAINSEANITAGVINNGFTPITTNTPDLTPQIAPGSHGDSFDVKKLAQQTRQFSYENSSGYGCIFKFIESSTGLKLVTSSIEGKSTCQIYSVVTPGAIGYSLIVQAYGVAK